MLVLWLKILKAIPTNLCNRAVWASELLVRDGPEHSRVGSNRHGLEKIVCWEVLEKIGTRSAAAQKVVAELRQVEGKAGGLLGDALDEVPSVLIIQSSFLSTLL